MSMWPGRLTRDEHIEQEKRWEHGKDTKRAHQT